MATVPLSHDQQGPRLVACFGWEGNLKPWSNVLHTMLFALKGTLSIRREIYLWIDTHTIWLSHTQTHPLQHFNICFNISFGVNCTSKEWNSWMALTASLSKWTLILPFSPAPAIKSQPTTDWKSLVFRERLSLLAKIISKCHQQERASSTGH